jgi:hypothetical protein
VRGKQLNQALILTDYNEPPENLLINEEKTNIPEGDTNYFKKLLQLFTSTHDWLKNLKETDESWLIMDRIGPSYMPTETEWRKAFGGTYSLK